MVKWNEIEVSLSFVMYRQAVSLVLSYKLSSFVCVRAMHTDIIKHN